MQIVKHKIHMSYNVLYQAQNYVYIDSVKEQ